MSKGVIGSSCVIIHLVDGEKPIELGEAGKDGAWVTPGEHRVQVEWTSTRPGVIYRSVTKSTGTLEKTIDVRPNATYDLTYDKKTGEFTFAEQELSR
ncbi:MAG: hypothetical protein FWD65_02355 [Coriobacteriia bacterium]|nr:hypothetical protein [Coriobacteriia bacterium]